MSQSGSQENPRAILLIGIALVGLLGIQTITLIVFVASFLQMSHAPPDTLGDFLDALIDAGHEDPVFTADDPLLRNRRVLLFHDVNSKTAKDVSARLMYLSSVDSKLPIDLYISTQGGWSDSAFTIIDTMRTIPAPVNTWAVGGCYSSGALILAAATGRRFATEDAILMIHTNLEDSREPYSFEPLGRERYERVYRETTRLPADWYPMTDDKERYLSPKEALAFRLIDEVVPVWRVARGVGKPPD